MSANGTYLQEYIIDYTDGKNTHFTGTITTEAIDYSGRFDALMSAQLVQVGALALLAGCLITILVMRFFHGR